MQDPPKHRDLCKCTGYMPVTLTLAVSRDRWELNRGPEIGSSRLAHFWWLKAAMVLIILVTDHTYHDQEGTRPRTVTDPPSHGRALRPVVPWELFRVHSFLRPGQRKRTQLPGEQIRVDKRPIRRIAMGGPQAKSQCGAIIGCGWTSGLIW